MLRATGALSLPRIARAARRMVAIAGPGGAFQQNYTTAVLDPFRRAHPDIDVTWTQADNQGQILNLLRRRQAEAAIDVALLELLVAKTATDAGLLAGLARNALPVLAELPDSAFVAGVAGPAVLLDCLAIAYAPARVKPPPTSWLALWQKDRAGQVVVEPAPAASGVAFTLIADALFGKGDYRESVTSGINAIRSMAPGIATWYPLPNVLDAVITGAAAMGVAWNAAGQMRARTVADKLAMAIPNEGSLFQVTTINLSSGARDLEAARAFIAYALGADAQAACAEYLCYTPVNQHAVLSAEALAHTASSPAQRERMMEVDWLAVAAMREDIAHDWRSRIIPHP
jgi:putative spermidine/putrescine transport system substrate-binding protein